MNRTLSSGRQAGWPRPIVKIEPDPEDANRPHGRFAIPWINGEHGDTGDFLSFRDGYQQAHLKRKCCVCGTGLGPVVVIGAYAGKRETSGGWGHPRCIRLAVHTCPHFAKFLDGTVAWRWEGRGVGVPSPEYSIDAVRDEAIAMTLADVDALAASDPMGAGDSE